MINGSNNVDVWSADGGETNTVKTKVDENEERRIQ